MRRPTYLVGKGARAEVGAGVVGGASSGGPFLVDLNQLGGDCVLTGHRGKETFQAGLERAQRLEDSEARDVCPDVFVEDQVEALELLAVDDERVQVEGLVNLQHGGGVLRVRNVRKRRGQSGGVQSDGGCTLRRAVLLRYSQRRGQEEEGQHAF